MDEPTMTIDKKIELLERGFRALVTAVEVSALGFPPNIHHGDLGDVIQELDADKKIAGGRP